MFGIYLTELENHQAFQKQETARKEVCSGEMTTSTEHGQEAKDTEVELLPDFKEERT